MDSKWLEHRPNALCPVSHSYFGIRYVVRVQGVTLGPFENRNNSRSVRTKTEIAIM